MFVCGSNDDDDDDDYDMMMSLYVTVEKIVGQKKYEKKKIEEGVTF